MSEAVKTAIDSSINNIYECVDKLREIYHQSTADNPNRLIDYFYWRGKLYAYEDILSVSHCSVLETIDRLVGKEIDYMDDIMNDTYTAIMNVYKSIPNDDGVRYCSVCGSEEE